MVLGNSWTVRTYPKSTLLLGVHTGIPLPACTQGVSNSPRVTNWRMPRGGHGRTASDGWTDGNGRSPTFDQRSQAPPTAVRSRPAQGPTLGVFAQVFCTQESSSSGTMLSSPRDVSCNSILQATENTRMGVLCLVLEHIRRGSH